MFRFKIADVISNIDPLYRLLEEMNQPSYYDKKIDKEKDKDKDSLLCQFLILNYYSNI
jgi:hypothetical protein